MDFELDTTDIARRFASLVDRANTEEFSVQSSWGMDVDQSRRQPVLKELNRALHTYNSCAGHAAPFPWPVSDDFDQALLNRLHEGYEVRYKRLSAGPGARSKSDPDPDGAGKRFQITLQALITVNRCIHMLESMAEIPKGSQAELNAWFSAGLVDSSGAVLEQPLRRDDYDLFTLTEEFGGLYLAYGIQGKNLHHIFLSEDVEFLKRGNVATVQQSVVSRVIALFGTVYKSHADELRRFHHWWDENDIDALGYSKDDPFNALGYIPIGRLAPLSDAERFHNRESGGFHEHGLVAFYNDFPEVESMSIVS